VRATDAHYPKDSLLTVTAARAQAWVVALQAVPVQGIQIDPYGVISVMAKHDAFAEQQIAARLATSGLSFADRAFTLQMAVVAFTSADFPERLPIAERYLAQLDAMGNEAALWQFDARQPIVYAYYRLGRSQDVTRIGTRALQVVSAIPFHVRGSRISTMGFNYGAIIDALSGQPNGRATIRTLNEQLLAAAIPSPELVAHDSLFVWEGQQNKRDMQHMVDVAERVGEPGGPIVANYWINRGATRDSQTVRVTDGKIHVIEIGGFTCPPCVAAVPGLNRLFEKYPAVDFTFLTFTEGVWGNRVIAPKAEAEKLAEHFLQRLHAKIPVGIAFAPRVLTGEGLSIPQIATLTWQAGQYPQAGKPTFYILDGKGTIRRVICGYNRDLEANMASIVEFLQNEAHVSGQASAQRLRLPSPSAVAESAR